MNEHKHSPPDSRDRWPFVRRKRADVLTDLEAVLSSAAGVEIDLLEQWPEQSQLFSVDADWYYCPTKWMRETAICLGDIYECARAWSRYWNVLVKTVQSDAFVHDDYAGACLWCGEALREFVDANSQVAFAMVRWNRTTLHDLHMALYDELPTYRFIVPNPLHELRGQRSLEVGLVLGLAGTSFARRTPRIGQYLRSVCVGSDKIRSAVSAVRKLKKAESGPAHLLKVWQLLFKIYCWSGEVAAASVVLLDEWETLFLSKPRTK